MSTCRFAFLRDTCALSFLHRNRKVSNLLAERLHSQAGVATPGKRGKRLAATNMDDLGTEVWNPDGSTSLGRYFSHVVRATSHKVGPDHAVVGRRSRWRMCWVDAGCSSVFVRGGVLATQLRTDAAPPPGELQHCWQYHASSPLGNLFRKTESEL